jgi:hypothetical protein
MTKSGTSTVTETVTRNSESEGKKPFRLTTKKINVDFNRPLRKHFDWTAAKKAWEDYKKA